MVPFCPKCKNFDKKCNGDSPICHILAEEDAKIFAEINKLVGAKGVKMDNTDFESLIKEANNISKNNKNVLDVNVNMKQSYLCYEGAHVKKDYREAVIYRSYRLNRETKAWETSGLNECYEGENFILRLYPLNIVKEQLEEIKRLLVVPSTIFRVGLVFAVSKFEQDSAGCAYLIKV